MADKKWYEVEADQLEVEIQKVSNIFMELREDYKRLNKHRNAHKKGLKDDHTRHQSVESHIEALGRMLKDRLKDIKEFREELHRMSYRMGTLGMYMDADHDMKIDAEQSIREVMQEMEIERRYGK